MQRRSFLIKTFSTGLVGWLTPGVLLANWPEKLFSLTATDQLISAYTQNLPVTKDGSVEIEAPKIAENGAQVRVSVTTALSEVETISLLVEKNPVPLTSQFMIAGAADPAVTINLKVRETSNVIALVKAGGKFYSAQTEVRVTSGGCA